MFFKNKNNNNNKGLLAVQNDVMLYFIERKKLKLLPYVLKFYMFSTKVKLIICNKTSFLNKRQRKS